MTSKAISGRTRSAPIPSTSNNNVVFNKLDKLFDVAIMMDCSQCPIHPHAQIGVHRIREKGQRHRARQGRQAGVLHVLGLCRQAGNDGATGRGLYGCRQRQQRAGDPGGPCLCEAVSKQPELNLYAPDKRHPSAGRHLSRVLRGVCGADRALAGRQRYLARIDAPTATFLQNVAWETVQEYYGK